MKYVFLIVIAAGIFFAAENFFITPKSSPLPSQETPTPAFAQAQSQAQTQAQTQTQPQIQAQAQDQQSSAILTPSPMPDSQNVASPSGAPWADKNNWISLATTATITTTKGTIRLQFFNSDAPKTVTNFETLARYHYYDGLTFHRVEPGFVVQGGDPNGNGTGGVSIYGPTFEDELNPNTDSYKAGYREGIVAMANRGPNTNGSQFFIMLADNPSLPHNYTIFARVISGMDVVHKLQVGDKMLSITVE